MSRSRKTTLAALAVALGVAGPGAAQEGSPSGISFTPNLTRAGSHLLVDVDPRGVDRPEGTPSRLSVLTQRGFKFDPRARRGRCSDAQARDLECPESSKVAEGTAKGRATGPLVPGGAFEFEAKIEAFLARPRESGDIADVIVEVREPRSGQSGAARGRLIPLASGRFGSELRFEIDSDGASPPPGVEIEIERVTLDAGARRTIVRTRRVRTRAGFIKRVRRRTRIDLITNPRTCRANWLVRLEAQYPGGPLVRDASVPCRTRSRP